jgi:hypothetical protein
MSEKPTSSNLRGSLLKRAAEDVGPLAVSQLRGTLIQIQSKEEIEASLVPEDYDLPEQVAGVVARKTANKDLIPFDDPNGIIIPGRVFNSAHDPKRRRLVTNVYTPPGGGALATIHIEGEPLVRTLSFSDIQGRVDTGALIVPDPKK